MLIKSEHKNRVKDLRKGKRRNSKWWRWGKRLVMLGVLAGLFFGGIWLGMKFNEGRGYTPNTLINKMANRFNAPSFGQGFEALSADAENINLNIKAEDLHRLYMHRANALDGNRAFDYVNATIDGDGKTIKVKIKLKGDREIHWEDIKQMSFRVKAKGDNTLYGMKKFSLQKPRTKNYIHEWLFHKCLERENLMHLRYKFVTLSLNGDDLGTYAIEEHFEKRLVESQQRREGPIIRFVEGPAYNFFTAPIEPYDGERWSVPGKIEQLTLAVNQMNAWRRGELKTSQVFDVDMMARFFALSDVLGAEHGTIWKSVKFYYNPISGKLEPIGVDAQLRFGYDAISSELGLRTDIGYINEKYDDWYNHLFVNENSFDSVFYNKYIQELERMAQTSYLNSLFAEIGDELDLNQAIIYKDFPLLADHITHYGPDFYKFDKNKMYARQKYIRYQLDALQGVQVHYHSSDSNYVYVDIGNISHFPMHVNAARFGDGGAMELDSGYRLKPRTLKGNINFTRMRIPIPDTIAWADSMATMLKVSYGVYGRNKYRDQIVYPWPENRSVAIDQHWMIKDSMNLNLPFIQIDRKNKGITFKTGDYQLKKALILPVGYTVSAQPGFRLDMQKGAAIISRSPWIMKGDEDHTIQFYSSDSLAQGIFVLNCGRSNLENVSFDNLSFLKHAGWGIYGAVNFYEANVDLKNCTFSNNRSEDGLNIIRSTFTMDGCVFSGTQSDAFDGDFIQGTVTNSLFKDLGNDAIDVSGSHIEVRNVQILRAADKGLSAGENSVIEAHTIVVEDSEIAVASKDKSDVIVDDLSIKNCAVGFTVFQKKPEFGPATVTATRVLTEGLQALGLNEVNSTLSVNGKELKPIEGKVEDVLYGVQYGKKTVR